MEPLISVIVPVFNAEAYLGAAVESVIAQRYPGWELLLVDDGSTDGSGALCDRYAKGDKRITACHIPNGGVSAARNYGIERAKGEYVCFLDSDDLLAPDHLSVLLAGIGNADLSLCGLRTFGDGFKAHWFDYLTNRVRNRLYTLPAFRADVLTTWFLPYVYTSCNKLFRRDVLNRYGIRYPSGWKIGEDAMLCLAYLSHAERIRCHSARTYHIRFRASSATRRYDDGRLNEQLRLYDAFDEFYRISDSTPDPLLQCYRIGRRLDVLTEAAARGAEPGKRLRELLDETGLPTAFSCFRRPCPKYFRFLKPYLTPKHHRKMQLVREGKLEEYLRACAE